MLNHEREEFAVEELVVDIFEALLVVVADGEMTE